METQAFKESLYKLHERLTIILDYNISAGVDPSEEDINLLKELYKWHDTSQVEWNKKEHKNRQLVAQGKLH